MAKHKSVTVPQKTYEKLLRFSEATGLPVSRIIAEIMDIAEFKIVTKPVTVFSLRKKN